MAPTFRVEGDQFHRIFWYAPRSGAAPPPSLTVERSNGGPLAVRMTLPPAGFAIYQAAPGLHRLGPNPPPDLKPWQPPRYRRQLTVGDRRPSGRRDQSISPQK